jgi:PAS domain-containing protein
MTQLKQFKTQYNPSKFNGSLMPDVERYLQTLVMSSPLILFALNSDGKVKYADGAALKSLGIPASEAVGKNAFDIYRSAPWTQNALRTVLKEKKTRHCERENFKWFSRLLVQRASSACI